MSKVLAETFVITRDNIGELAWAMICLRNLLTFFTLPSWGEFVLLVMLEFDFFVRFYSYQWYKSQVNFTW